MYASYDERMACMPVMMRGPLVCQLCVGRYRETKKQPPDDEFHGGVQTALCVASLLPNEVFKHAWSLFEANIA